MTVVSLDEIKEHLNITNDQSDGELAGIIDAAEAVIAKRVGPLEPTEFTSVVDSGGGSMSLPKIPVISVTSVTSVDGFGSTAPGLTLDGETGVLTPTTNFGWFGGGGGLAAGRYSVTYVAGRDECPADLILAVKEMVRHFWESKNGGSTYEGAPDFGGPFPPLVKSLLAPYTQFGFGLV